MRKENWKMSKIKSSLHPPPITHQVVNNTMMIFSTSLQTLAPIALLILPACESSSFIFQHQEIPSLLKDLANNPQQPSLWRRLGKLQLDAGEFAEARRIFCEGSSCCPSDDQLKHHEKVFRAFHETGDAETTTPASARNKEPLPSLFNNEVLENPELFLSFNVNPNKIPESIRKHPSSMLPADLRQRLIHASTAPVLKKDACQRLIQEAIQTTNHIGWTKDRHVQAPTCDVPVLELEPTTQQWIQRGFSNVLFPLLCRLVSPELDIDPKDLRMQDCFIVRYDAKDEEPGFASLRPHQDESLLSLTIALNDMDGDYTDGGLWLEHSGDILNGPAGTVLCFAGGLVHGGFPVSQGTRWILTGFLYVDSNQSGQPAGYTLTELEKLKSKIA